MSMMTYSGVLDDVAWQYPWPSVRLGPAYVNQQLIQNLIYDRVSVVNDSHLVANPVLREQIIHHDTSLAGALFRTGNLVLYHRGEDTAQLAQGLDWLATRPEVRKQRWSQQYHIGGLFVRLLEGVLDADDAAIGFGDTSKAEFEQVLKAYQQRNANDRSYPGARGS